MNLQKYSGFVLRIGLGIVLLWFGINEVIDPAKWSAYIPEWMPLPFSTTTFAFINGLVEIAFALLLLAGAYTRIIAVLVALHLLGIVVSVGYNEIGIRDFGLLMSAVALALAGAGAYSVDERRKNY